MRKIDKAGANGINSWGITYRKHYGSETVAYRAFGRNPRHPENGPVVKRIYRKDGTSIKERPVWK